MKESDKVVELPPSWVCRLHMDRESFLRRYASEAGEVKRSRDYRKSRAELFADNSRPDGMVQRLTHFSDLARTRVVQVSPHPPYLSVSHIRPRSCFLYLKSLVFILPSSLPPALLTPLLHLCFLSL